MLSRGENDVSEPEPNQNTIVFHHTPEQSEEVLLHYKKNNKKTSPDNGDNTPSSSPTEPSTTSPPHVTPSRRGHNSRPGIKLALPPTEVQSSLLIYADSTILTSTELLVLVGWMPKYQRLNEFHRSYDLKHDGASLETIYSICSDPDISASFIIIEAEDGHLFGGFINEPFKKSSTYYGSGESFVFSIRPDLAVYRCGNSNGNSNGSGSNSRGSSTCVDQVKTQDSDLGMFVLSDSNQLLMGGGEGFAFRLDDELHFGCSQPCATYQNRTLSESEFFTCVNAEVWTTKPAPVIIPLPPSPPPSVSESPVAVQSPPPEDMITLTFKKKKK